MAHAAEGFSGSMAARLHSHRDCLKSRPLVVLLVLLACVPLAHAVPSPDLVINAFASLAQIAGLITAASGAAFLRLRGGGVRGPGAGRWFAALCTVALIAICANVWQYVRYSGAQTQRLEANLWRKPGDWNRAFAAPAIASHALDAQLAQKLPVRLVDVREPEEFEVAHLPGAENIRYADLLLGVRTVPNDGVPTVFVCDSGKRSGEVCEALAKRGLPCSVLEGGYPKWARENRPLSPPADRWRKGFVALPRYARDTVYLDTPQVAELVNEEQARFIDVRSPSEFERGHLPQAINLPMRGLSSQALAQAVAALTAGRPYMVACYDNRSCFHARVLGLKLTRLGLDFRGRYTVPHEYPMPPQIAERGLWARAGRATSAAIDLAVQPLARGLAQVADALGSLVLAMCLLLAATRLPFLPAVAKAHKDRLIDLQHGERAQALRKRYGADEYRWRRAVANLRKAHGATPWRNLAVSLFQLGLFLVCFAAVNSAARWRDEPFLWLPDLSEPDPLRLLAAVIGVLVFSLALNALESRVASSRARIAASAAAAGAMVWFAWGVSSAIGVYLIGSLAIVRLQQSWVGGWPRMLSWRSWRRLVRHGTVATGLAAVPLEHCSSRSDVGGKAVRQGRMRAAGLPVPPGWVIPGEVLGPAFEDGDGSPRLHDVIGSIDAEPGTHYAVRSSALGEDGGEHSFAGVFRSELNVEVADLAAAIRRVWASYADPAASLYAAGAAQAGGVIVQRMVPAEHSGVLFTRDPSHGGAILVECVQGLGDALASGHATPQPYRFGYVSGRLLAGEAEPPIDFAPLLGLARRIEDMFGTAQDIEWAFEGGRFHILQARDVAAARAQEKTEQDLIEDERRRVLTLLRNGEVVADEAALVQTDLTAGLPNPTPMSLSIMQMLRADGGSTDRAFERLGLAYRPAPDGQSEVQSVFGRAYELKSSAQQQAIGVLAAYRLSRAAAGIESQFLDAFAPRHLAAMRLRELVDVDRLDDQELVATLQAWTQEFAHVGYVEADVINIAAEFYARSFARALANDTSLSVLRAADAPAAPASLATHAHRAVHDWELGEPRFGEAPVAFERHYRNAAVPAPGGTAAEAADLRQGSRKLSDAGVSRALRFARLKEQAKHICLREYAQLRRVLLVLDGRWRLEGLIFFLRLEEVPGMLGERADELRQLAAQRRRAAQAFGQVSPGTSLSVRDLEDRVDVQGAIPRPSAVADTRQALTGTRVSGQGEITATVRVLLQPADAALLQHGEIAVVRQADPVWLTTFDRAAGLISEVGGWLAHLAIVAREKNVPAVFGVRRATLQLKTGDRVTLCRDGSVRLPAGTR